MDKLPALGLRTRIAVALAVVLVIFIVLTEFSISRLTRVAISRIPATIQNGEDTGKAQSHPNEDLLQLRKLVMFYMITGAVVALILGSWAVTRLVVRPLGKITQAVEQVADGKLKTQLPIAGSGELIRLGVAFNRMTGTLQEQQTQLKERLEQLEKSSDNLKAVQGRLIRAAKLASVGTLAAGVAHEIGNPLAGVLGLVNALDEEEDPEKSEEYRKLMRREIERIDRIINDLLAYARPVRSDANIQEATTLEEVLSHVLALLSAQNLFDQVDIDATLSKGPWSISISRDELTQLLINLFLNAAQAMEGKGKITLGAERVTDWRPGLGVVVRDAVRMSVIDTGPGVPQEQIDKIFDPFFSKRKSDQGSGLGLAICQSICDRAGGEIVLDKEYSSGSKFIITLLAAQV